MSRSNKEELGIKGRTKEDMRHGNRILGRIRLYRGHGAYEGERTHKVTKGENRNAWCRSVNV